MSADNSLTHFSSRQELAALDLLHTVTWVFNVDDHAFWWANKSALSFWEVDTQEDFLAIDLSDDSPIVRQRLNDIFNSCTKGELVEENWTLYPSNKPKMVVISFRPILLEDNKRAVLLEASPQLKDELDPRAKRILEAARNTSIMVSTFSFDGHLLAQNPSAATVYGSKADSKVTWQNRYHENDLDKQFVENAKNQTAFTQDIRVKTKNGFCWHRLAAEVGRDPVTGDRVLVVTEEDVTQRIAAQRDLKELNLTLEQRVTERTEKLSAARKEAEKADKAKTDFLATMSHELRTPLNAIIGFSEMLTNNVYGPINDRQATALSDINRSGHHLLEQINELLDASTIDSGKLNLFERKFPVHNITGFCQSIFALEANKKNQTFKVQCDIPDLLVNADEHRIRQVIINLLTNAIKYTPEGGEISFNAYKSEDDCLVFKVVDSGIGIPSDQLRKVFQAFMQVDNPSSVASGKGVGLGLYISLQLMKLHGGTLDMTSEEGVGTTVSAILPAERLRINVL